jgi:hypothetical protein
MKEKNMFSLLHIPDSILKLCIFVTLHTSFLPSNGQNGIRSIMSKGKGDAFEHNIMVVKPVGMAAGTTWLIVVIYIN